MSQQSTCGPKVTATPSPECLAAQAVTHMALFWTCGSRKLFLRMTFWEQTRHDKSLCLTEESKPPHFFP